MRNNTAIFCKRVWNTEQEVYLSRLNALGFCGMDIVLDAGGGCGQWTNALAKINKTVDYVEPDIQRVEIAKEKINHLNVAYYNRSLENFDYKSDYYEGLFCYSVIYFCDLNKVLKCFYDSLKTGGKLYICSNNIEFYYYNIINSHNTNRYFNAKDNALKIIKNTMLQFQENVNVFPVIYSDLYLKRKLKDAGFIDIKIGHEGELSNEQHSFYPKIKFGYKSVYEITASK